MASVRARTRSIERRMVFYRVEERVEFVAEMFVKQWSWAPFLGVEPPTPDDFAKRIRREGFNPPGINSAIGYLVHCQTKGEIPEEKTLIAKVLPWRSP